MVFSCISRRNNDIWLIILAKGKQMGQGVPEEREPGMAFWTKEKSFLFVCLLVFLGPYPAYGVSRARGRNGTTATDLRQSCV